MTASELREQMVSFTLGNSAIERTPLHRGTVTRALPTVTPKRGAIASSIIDPRPPQIPSDVEGSIRQFNLIRSFCQTHHEKAPIQITPQLIKEIHAAGGGSAGGHLGVFRQVDVQIKGSSLKPPPPSKLENAVSELCARLIERWAEDDATTLSAYALWRLNWIHPFVDGNGRTARALSYLVLNLKLGAWLPGAPTVLEQLSERRDKYFDALVAADIEFSKGREPTLFQLRLFLEELLHRQLNSMPALSEVIDAQLADVIKRRFLELEKEQLEKIFGTQDIGYRAWSISDYLLLHVASRDSLNQAEALFSAIGEPFPGLLASPGERSVISLTREQRGVIVKPREFQVGDGAALWLDQNAAVVVENPSVSRSLEGVKSQWAASGVIYILRRGEDIPDLWVSDVFDILAARHLQGVKSKWP